MITYIFTHIHLCKVTMNYMSYDILYTCAAHIIHAYHVVLFQKNFVSISVTLHLWMSTCTYQYTTSLQLYMAKHLKDSNMRNIKISAYLDIDTTITHVIIYKYQSLHPLHIAIYCELQWHVQQWLHWRNDMQLQPWNKDYVTILYSKITWHEWRTNIISDADTLGNMPQNLLITVASCILCPSCHTYFTLWSDTTHVSYFTYCK